MRGYYRIPKKTPANRVDGALADLVREKFAEGWAKAKIAREIAPESPYCCPHLWSN